MTQLTQKPAFLQTLPSSGVAASEWALDTLFGPRKPDAWIAVVQDPLNQPQWAGGRYSDLGTALRTATGSGHYFSCVLVRPGEIRRLNRTAESGICVFFDDVGDIPGNPHANIDKDWLDNFGLDPTFVVETSAGNFQYTYVFETPVAPIDQLRLAKAFKANPHTRGGFRDGNDLVRYGRLPSGVNPKAGRGGFRTRLTAGSGRTYTLDEIVEGFRLKLDVSTDPRALLDGDDDGGLRTLDVDASSRVDLVRSACEAILNDLDRTDWIHMAHAIDGALGGDPAGRDIFVEFTWRRTTGDNDPDKARIAWDTLGEGRAGYGFLMRRLRAQGTPAADAVLGRIVQAQARVVFAGAPPSDPDEPMVKLVPLPFVSGRPPSKREWLVLGGWAPMRKVTLLQGDGGDGKTLLMHQLQASCATGLPWVGLNVEPCASVGVYTEDDDEDVDERQAAIDLEYGVECCLSGRMWRFPRAGEENELVVFDRARRASTTRFYAQVVEAVQDLGARLLVLDVAVDLYGGNEIVRPEVRALFRPLIKLAQAMNGAVVMSMHVSQSGIRTDGGHSGSTDWSNAARSRLYLNRPKDDDGNLLDPDARTLTRKKANYAALGDTVALRWSRGVLVPDGPGAAAQAFRRSVEDVFMDLLASVTAEGQIVSAKFRAGNYAPNVFMKRSTAEKEGYGRADFERALQAVFKAGRIENEAYGKPKDGYEKLVKK